jgi:serine/threonine-protein kinase
MLWDDHAETWSPEETWSVRLQDPFVPTDLVPEILDFARSCRNSDENVALEIIFRSEDVFRDPERIGRYSIVRRIGDGGMGVVYEARDQDDDLDTRVAVKVIKIGLDTESFVRRFRSESYVLSRLVHPNIVKILFAGSTQEGRPYFVMEFVKDGVPIETFCKAEKLSLAARLRLFQKVCGAVNFAHENLIVHRDLKPSNILVTPNREPKLLDFGLDKLLEDDESLPSFAKIRGGALQIGTPAYMSPEQKEIRPVSTATDIYALGALLYELVTGKLPAREGKLILPSEALSDNEELAKELHSIAEIDQIIMRALMPKPEDRYSSASEFSDFIQKLLDGEPALCAKIDETRSSAATDQGLPDAEGYRSAPDRCWIRVSDVHRTAVRAWLHKLANLSGSKN